MKAKTLLIALATGALLAFTFGCGKKDEAAAPTSQASQPTVVTPAPLPPKTEAFSPPMTNASVAQVQAASTPPTKPAKPSDTLVSALKEAAPKAPEAATPMPDKAPGLLGQAKAALADVSQDQMVQGLKDALARGLQEAVARLGHEGGFLTNVNVKIPMPGKLQKIELTLRSMKQDKLADDFVTTMNRAAEQAVPEAGSVFAAALKQMTIDDAKSILSGPNDAATQYFQKATQTNLYTKFYPIIQKATQATGVTAAYKNLLEKAKLGEGLGSLGNLGSALGGALLGQDSLDIDAYVTNKTMDGLFKTLAEEEQKIRLNPAARTTELLQKVFGALKK